MSAAQVPAPPPSDAALAALLGLASEVPDGAASSGGDVAIAGGPAGRGGSTGEARAHAVVPFRLVEAAGDPDLPDVPGAALYVATSGSTRGHPSIVALSAAQLRASATATHERLGGGGDWLLTVPPDHVAGVMVRVRALLAGRRVLRSEGPFRADTFADAVARLVRVDGPRRYCSLVPTQLRRVLADVRATDAARAFDSILVGGAASPPAMLAAAREAGLAVVTTYGMTETAGGCVYDGVPLPGVDVTLARDDDASPSDAGRIVLTGPQVALGYVTPSGLAPFEGRFATADRGRWHAGRLEVLGRADDAIVTGGFKVDPHRLEAFVAGLPGVAEAAVVGIPDDEWGHAVALAVVAGAGLGAHETEAVLAERVRHEVRAALGAPWVPRHVALLDGLPLRGVGKPDRRALAALLAASARGVR